MTEKQIRQSFDAAGNALSAAMSIISNLKVDVEDKELHEAFDFASKASTWVQCCQNRRDDAIAKKDKEDLAAYRKTKG